jgi:MSHA biogenesis protein MshI
MKQQVNLLTDELKPRRDPFTINQLLAAWGVFALVLLGVSVWSGADYWQLAQQQAQTQEQWQLLKETNERLRASYSAQPDPQLEARVAELRLEQFERRQLMALLADYHDRQLTGFSAYLDDLARHGVDGMWLSEISLQTGGRWIQLKGLAIDPAQVPEFLRELSESDSFDGHQFNGFELKEAEGGLIEFEIAGPEQSG